MSLQELKNRVFGGGTSEISSLFYLAKELSCIGDIVGREFEVRDDNGRVVFLVKQRPLKITQINVLLKELQLHNKRLKKQSKEKKRKR